MKFLDFFFSLLNFIPKERKEVFCQMSICIFHLYETNANTTYRYDILFSNANIFTKPGHLEQKNDHSYILGIAIA